MSFRAALVLQTRVTALWAAAQTGCLELVRALIRGGADLEARTKVRAWVQVAGRQQRPLKSMLVLAAGGVDYCIPRPALSQLRMREHLLLMPLRRTVALLYTSAPSTGITRWVAPPATPLVKPCSRYGTRLCNSCGSPCLHKP